MDELINKLSDLRSQYNCFDENEEPFYRALSDAIRILSQQVDGDTISRQAAIDAYGDWYVEEGTADGFIGTVKQLLEGLPSAQPGSQWTPVTEGKPKDGEEVFVYLFDRSSPYIAWVENGRWYTEEFEVDREYEPLAWMPLPEPWKGEKNELRS